MNLKETRHPVKTALQEVELEGERYFKIPDSDRLRPFLMSIVSDSNHWMFISSNGGLTAGRKNANFALFPYYTDDKITETAEITGSKSVFRVQRGKDTRLWEPFSIRQAGQYRTSRNLYKHVYGNKVVFEEINHDLGLGFRYQWSSSNRFGFVRRATLTNLSDKTMHVSLLDGIQNLMPYGVGSDLQNRQSNLVDAYKRNELLEDAKIGIYALSAIIVDKAEPSEALKANIAWSTGLEPAVCLVSSLQLAAFRLGGAVRQETDVKAEKGAYFVSAELDLPGNGGKSWMIVANVNQDQSSIAALAKSIREEKKGLEREVLDDVDRGTSQLVGLCAASDGLHCSRDSLRDTRHFSNTLFNIMRGGIFDEGYTVERWDFERYLRQANREVFGRQGKRLAGLPETFSIEALKRMAGEVHDPDFERLALEYLPLKFSRRHGDPSRPWNVFSINTSSELDGSKILDYEGNWRDIFQNWEALAHSYPEYIEGMILKFLNASTFDGYNPYRVTKGGFDWEVIEPDDPWSYIGYWGDHQLIYLLKFLECSEQHFPGRLNRYFEREIFVYANVPYRIRDYEGLLRNPKDTIDFDADSDHRIRKDREAMGADGALLRDAGNGVHRVNFIEKILATLLAKMSNFIPEGGIWMNTQRPEWNDANNALVGNGVSMVTLYYMRRFLAFFSGLLEGSAGEEVQVSEELHLFFEEVAETLRNHQSRLSGGFGDLDRRRLLDGLGMAASRYRQQVYGQSFSGRRKPLPLKQVAQWFDLAQRYLEHSIRANERPDHLYHAYNIMSLEPDGGISIAHLDEMLEGQVAVLSSGYLTPRESLQVLDALKASALFREDQYSYLLYPNKELPRFMEKNNIPESEVLRSPLLCKLLEQGHRGIVLKDVEGKFHFNGNFRNAGDLRAALEALPGQGFNPPAEDAIAGVLEIFEKVFNHKSFTGRSGTFFGYEGLGSIYWHMVSKLLLAVQECCLKAIRESSDALMIGKLLEHYYEINEGIGVHKSPELYGAFPTDPYSHTPLGKGAQQPGMTGQVKEDILSRFGELGVAVQDGQIAFRPGLLRRNEFLTARAEFGFVGADGKAGKLLLEKDSLGFTVCQVPVIYSLASTPGILVQFKDGSTLRQNTCLLDLENSAAIFGRSGDITQVTVFVTEEDLR